MPQTPQYGFEYESPQSTPGVTLTAGPSGTTPILAIQLEAVISAIDARLQTVETTGFRLLTTEYYTANDTFTKASYTGIRAVRARLVAGGGGGGGAAATGAGEWAAGGGGSGGTYAEAFILEASLAASVAVTVGIGGAGGVGLNPGVVGGESSFGALVQADGGDGGDSEAALTGDQGVSGGVGTNTGIGDIIIPGGDGGNAMSTTPSMVINMPTGGESALGARSRASSTTGGNDGFTGWRYGSGGSGAFNDTGEVVHTGGTGADGIVIVNVYV